MTRMRWGVNTEPKRWPSHARAPLAAPTLAAAPTMH